MPRRAASFTQADIVRAIRAAREAGHNQATLELNSGAKLVVSNISVMVPKPRVMPPHFAEPKWKTAQRNDAMQYVASYVYFIGSGSSAIKIGISDGPYTRIQTLQTAHYEPLKLLGTMQGHIATEQLLHKEFTKEHLRGEWFKRSKRLLAFISDNCTWRADDE